MRNNGKNVGISQGSRRNPSESDGKKRPSRSSTSSKLTVKNTKYTIIRSKQDIKNLDKSRKQICMNDFSISTKTDSAIYQALPTAYLNAVKKVEVQDLLIRILTAELDQLAQLFFIRKKT